MFAQIQINEPIDHIIHDWDYLSDKVVAHFSTFKEAGQNILGLRRRMISSATMNDPKKGNISRVLELNGSGFEERQHDALSLRVTAAGNPHRVMHNFGYWHINDKDELYLPIPAEFSDQLGYYVVIMGKPKGSEIDSFAWYCEKCETLLHDHVVETSKTGLAGFWRGERAAVNGYNGDINLRTCPECNHVNPLAYCWNKAKDTPAEAEARLCW
jgi:hypothetical protein